MYPRPRPVWGGHLARVLLALILVSLVAACAQPTPTPQPVTIDFAFFEADEAYYQALATAFSREHPNTTINLLPRDWGILERLEADDADVFVVYYLLRERLERGDLVSLDTWLTSDEAFDRDDLYRGTLSLYTRDGKTWAIPAAVDVDVMYYNKDLFDERQVAYPKLDWTWEDFIFSAQNLTDASIGLYGYAAGASPEDPVLFVIQHGGKLVDDWQSPTRTTLDDPLTIEALEWYADLIYRHGVSPTPEEARRLFSGGQYALYAGVVSGKIGLWTSNYSAQGGRTWGRKWEFRWGLTTLPRDKEAATLARVEGLAISSQAENPEACWQWISFLSRQVPARLAPARRSVAESLAFEQQAGAEAAAVARASLEQAILIPPDIQEMYDRLGRLWTEVVEEVLSGEVTAQEALTRAQAEAQK